MRNIEATLALGGSLQSGGTSLIKIILDVIALTARTPNLSNNAALVSSGFESGTTSMVSPVDSTDDQSSAPLRFIDQFLQKAPRGSLTGLLLGQLDAFNRIATTFGRSTSKCFCAEHAEQMRRSLPPGSAVIRLPGRRFMALVKFERLEQVPGIAAPLTQTGHARVRIGEDWLLVDLTFGIAVYPSHADDAATLIRRAELALEEARKRGLGYEIYVPDSTRRLTTLWKLESELDEALRQGDLHVLFQPKVATKTRRVCGVEALIRWRTPSGVVIPPDQFVPLAEHSGNIAKLTWLVFERVLEAVHTWSRLPRPFSVAINLPPQLLTHPELLTRLGPLCECARATGIEITLELTEDNLVRSDDVSQMTLRQLRDIGVGIAIDDFGKGYSSLGYLKNLPAKEVKIDQQFIAGLGTDPKDQQIVKAIVEIARAFKLNVVAEGVETVEHLRIVTQLGCDLVQGFYIARPMPGDVVAEWADNFVRHQTAV